jgi:hypothetical protein
MGFQDHASPAPTLICTYIDDGGHSPAGFETFLRRFAAVLAVVPRWRVVCVAERQRSIAAASAVFARAFGADSGLAQARQLADVGEFFRLRRLYEREAWAELNTIGLHRYMDLWAAIGADLDPLYARWECEGDRVLEDLAPRSGVAGAGPLRGGAVAVQVPRRRPRPSPLPPEKPRRRAVVTVGITFGVTVGPTVRAAALQGATRQRVTGGACGAATPRR